MAKGKNIAAKSRIVTVSTPINVFTVKRKMTSKSSVKVATKGSGYVVERKHLITDGK